MLFKNGQWEKADKLADGIAAVCEKHGGDMDAALAEMGFEPWTRIGDTEQHGINDPIGLVVYKRHEAPSFVVLIDGNLGTWGGEVYADSMIDMMDLIARWGPGVKAAADVARGPKVAPGDGTGRGRPLRVTHTDPATLSATGEAVRDLVSALLELLVQRPTGDADQQRKLTASRAHYAAGVLHPIAAGSGPLDPDGLARTTEFLRAALTEFPTPSGAEADA